MADTPHMPPEFPGTSHADYRRAVEEIVSSPPESGPSFDPAEVLRAFEFAYKAHDGQVRRSGEPYIGHPIEVLRILVRQRMDQDTLIAGLLHDTVEDCESVELTDIVSEFGEHVAVIVDGVTKIGGLKFASTEHRQSVNYRKMLLSMSRDIRVIFVKFADRLHNMRTIDHLSTEKSDRIARETLDVYAPLAHRFGMGSIKWELEDLCLKVLEPEFYNELVEKIDLKREQREEVIELAIRPLREKLVSYGVAHRIFGRPKHFYSIWNKIHQRHKTFEEILDLFAIRIIVERLEDCYFALGTVHNIYNPIADRFSDYVATPKSNGYQSLHTKVVGPGGRTLEIQIRTEEMNRVAEFGLAAHWIYKEGGDRDRQLNEFFTWIKQVLDENAPEASSDEFLEGFKINLYQDDIFVFSPKGDLYKLPKGATPIDFAFAVHTNVGLNCSGARVDRRMVPLDTELTSGSIVEILTSKTQRPSQDWLRIATTNRARSKIRRWLKERRWHESRDLGEEMFRRELERNQLVAKEVNATDLAQSMGYKAVDQLYAALGAGDVTMPTVMRKVIPEDADAVQQTLLRRLFRRSDKRKPRRSAVRISGLQNMVVQFGRCCQPLPGDEIVGFVATGQGVKIHRANCANVSQMVGKSERQVDVEWDSERNDTFNSRLMVVATDRKSLIHDISDTLAKLDVNISQFTMKRQEELAIGRIVIEVKNLSQLQSIINKLKAIPKVIRVDRHDQSADW
ncbi:MAG: bifunctional (p)ppGpp synthetase/guanosine-3',5'-bis(diphosphate) 3'-pyrophosphohydrolase [Calditrichaeota bacterium]|nr:bifunctional (p)ppGpp synthetase/guanosine-3',5'-bis(diphosphate) 3'-pyrophosphohydrolase [Candidatus Cloacimonadota bacterium]MCB1047185.1 bifunctional (p)ppGpp synthetase/guanosine-3',5'-bis(diphosphate) 3'-pyrophosphohydrolase [Calditrichota bacterium]MCB9474387.1 bifunctional (p)ppGpp synthetase/guanosine-3',5'-bis(diphosphate) 3'-pyrophosphohydrolase [Candidatus Delongbacteria bacterium]